MADAELDLLKGNFEMEDEDCKSGSDVSQVVDMYNSYLLAKFIIGFQECSGISKVAHHTHKNLNSLLPHCLLLLCPNSSSTMMQPAATGDGADNDPDDLNMLQNLYYDPFCRSHYVNPFINPFYLHEPKSPQLDIYSDNMPDPCGLPYPPTPLHQDHPEVNQDICHIPEILLDPISLSILPLTKPNLGDYHPTFSLPPSQAGPSRTMKRQQPKIHDDPFIHYSAESLSQKEKKRVKSFDSNAAPSADSVTTRSSLLSTMAPSLLSAMSSSSTAAIAVPPSILYDKGNSVHQQIVEIAMQNILGNAVNLVCKMLATAVTSCCHDQTFSEEWAATNFEALLESLSAPFELIMATCKTLVQAKIECRYHLCPSPCCGALCFVGAPEQKMVNIIFSVSTYKHMYDQLMDYITKHIACNQELVMQWGDFKCCRQNYLRLIVPVVPAEFSKCYKAMYMTIMISMILVEDIGQYTPTLQNHKLDLPTLHPIRQSVLIP
ncbi:hypothetical protein BDR04DRAFT_1119556 [Suillus decipiens]|nr:hypothetical protein BDR04DRAFT_1119556 [Suillus decipiens]